MFKPYGLTYTLVWFVILSNIPSGKKLRGLSKMVLKNKISTHYTSDDLIDIVKAPNITDRFFFLNMFVVFFWHPADRRKKKMFSSWNSSPFQSSKANQSIFQFTHNCSSTSLSKALLSIVLILRYCEETCRKKKRFGDLLFSIKLLLMRKEEKVTLFLTNGNRDTS